MSINQLLLPSDDSKIESWKNLGLNNLHVKSLYVNSSALLFNRFDSTIQVNTYDGANNIVDAGVFSLNVHGSLVGHSITISIAAMSHTATNVFNYFGFQLPAGFFPNTVNSGLYLINLTFPPGAASNVVSRYTVTTSGIVRIFVDLNSANSVIGEIFLAPEQSIIISNTN